MDRRAVRLAPAREVLAPAVKAADLELDLVVTTGASESNRRWLLYKNTL